MRTASETVALVLDQEGPALDSDQDVMDLTVRLRGHVEELAPLAKALTPKSAELHAAVAEARQLAQQEALEGHLMARVHLRKLATTVQQILDQHGSMAADCPNA